jgi:hypothetical protein
VAVLQLSTLNNAYAQGLTSTAPMIFDVRRSLPLEPTEPVYHDFYINAGPEAGFKKGQYMVVVRYVPVHDPIQNKQQGELPINVARLQVIQVSPTITVARLVSEFTDEERPTLEYESIMIGDRIDPQSLTMDPPKHKAKAQKETLAEPKIVPHESERAVSAAPAAVPVAVVGGATMNPETVSIVSTPSAGAPVEALKSTSPAAKMPDMVRVPVPAVPEKSGEKNPSEAASDMIQKSQKL